MTRKTAIPFLAVVCLCSVLLAQEPVNVTDVAVVNLLTQLRNSYPPATLHDCDESDDKNPVRLGTSVLGR